MPATPAWPPQSAPRLYVDAPLAAEVSLTIDGNSAHYLISVMRVRDGDIILLFDNRSGEWAAEARTIRKRDLSLHVLQQTRQLETVPDFWLCAAPIKKGRIDLVAEKACELGVAKLQPVMTRRSVVDKLNLSRLQAHLVEAAEQCGRTALPHLAEMVKLADLLRQWPIGRHLFFADEQGGVPMVDALEDRNGPAAFLIGPEGGFNDDERAAIRAHPAAIPVSLGPRILRAETAAIAATSIWMARWGDWQEAGKIGS